MFGKKPKPRTILLELPEGWYLTDKETRSWFDSLFETLSEQAELPNSRLMRHLD